MRITSCGSAGAVRLVLAFALHGVARPELEHVPIKTAYDS